MCLATSQFASLSPPSFCCRRQYCTNRLRRLYKALKFTHGTKTRYTPRKLLPQDVSDPRCEGSFAWRGAMNPKSGASAGCIASRRSRLRTRRHLLIPLVNAERAWAYAMELKQAGDDPRKRHHLARSLAHQLTWPCDDVAEHPPSMACPEPSPVLARLPPFSLAHDVCHSPRGRSKGCPRLPSGPRSSRRCATRWRTPAPRWRPRATARGWCGTEISLRVSTHGVAHRLLRPVSLSQRSCAPAGSPPRRRAARSCSRRGQTGALRLPSSSEPRRRSSSLRRLVCFPFFFPPPGATAPATLSLPPLGRRYAPFSAAEGRSPLCWGDVTHPHHTAPCHSCQTQVGSLEQSAVCRQRLGELEPSLRYCSYKGGNASASDLSSAFAAGTAGFDFLKDKLDAVAAEARLKVAAEVKSIPWRGLSLPVRSEATRVLLISASELVQQIEAAEVTGAASGERQMASFDKLLLALTDARRQVRMDLGAAAGEALISELRALDFAVTCMSLARTLQRNRLLLTTLQARWARQQQEEAEGGAAGAPAGKKAAGRGGKGGADRADEKPVRLQELVRLFDTVLGNVSEMAEVAGEAARTGGPAAEEAGKVARECAAEEALIRAERCALLARAQLVGAKFAEAAALFGRSAELAQRAAAALAASSSSSSAAAAGGKGKQQQGAGAEHQRLLALAESLGTSARKERCVAIVKGVSAQMAGRKARAMMLALSVCALGSRAFHGWGQEECNWMPSSVESNLCSNCPSPIHAGSDVVPGKAFPGRGGAVAGGGAAPVGRRLRPRCACPRFSCHRWKCSAKTTTKASSCLLTTSRPVPTQPRRGARSVRGGRRRRGSGAEAGARQTRPFFLVVPGSSTALLAAVETHFVSLTVCAASAARASFAQARLPPALQPMPARPLFLDTALTAIEYPSLAHRVKASKEGRAAGIRSAVTSLFGWRS